MDVSLRSVIKEHLKSNPDWLEQFDSRHISALVKMNSDILSESVQMVGDDGFLIERKILPKKYFHKIRLYAKLRQHRRCKKNQYGERMLALMKQNKE